MTELELAARTAWAEMTRTVGPLQRFVDRAAGAERLPMPPGVALDMVQEHTGGDRDEAYEAITRAGAAWIEMQTQPSSTNVQCMELAVLLTGAVRESLIDGAALHLANLRALCGRMRGTQDDRIAAAGWERWADKAEVAINWCYELSAATYAG